MLSLIALSSCSTNNPPAPPVPDFLLEKASPLVKPQVSTTSDIVKRLLAAEAQYAILRKRFNILIDWILPSES